MTPMNRAAIGPTKPAAWVTVASPATAPETAPRALVLPLRIHSTALQLKAPLAADSCVATKALVARLPADNALPALKPNHPTHNMDAPTKVSTMLCGGMASCG